MSKAQTAESTGKEIVNVDEMLKKELGELNQRTGPPPSNKISTKGKVFTLPGGESNSSLSVVVLDWRYVLAHYPGAFNPNNPQDPDCFAVGSANPESGSLKPHENIAKPHAADCNSCPKNQWGSAATGKGKACKNQVRLMVVPPKFDANTQPLTLYVSPTGLRNWNAYLMDLNNSDGLHFMQVITDISFDPNETYPKLQFKRAAQNANLNEAYALRTKWQDVVDRPIELRNKGDGK